MGVVVGVVVGRVHGSAVFDFLERWMAFNFYVVGVFKSPRAQHHGIS